MNKLLILSLLALCYQSASAQLVTESFGTGANAFTMDFVTIGNPNNAADTTGSPNPVGSVGYIYNIGKYEVSKGQVDKANTAGTLGITNPYGRDPGGNYPVGVSWYEVGKFVNWLNTSKGFVPAYKFDANGNFQIWSAGDAGYNANNLFRNSNAKFWIPSTDEWYKAAYGNLDETWNKYPTGSDSAPTAVASGTAANTAVYDYNPFGPADFNNAGGLSPWGAMGQGGNLWEWTETAYDGINNTAGEDRELRGGSWYTGLGSIVLESSFRTRTNPSANQEEEEDLGFRVAMIPEPSSLSLLALGGVVVALRRRK